MRSGSLLLLALAACYVGPPRYGPPAPPPARPPPAATRPPPAAPARVLGEQEAVEVAVSYARSQGAYVSRVKRAHLDGAGRWHVELRGDGRRQEMKVLVDGFTGQVLRAKLEDD